MSEQQEIDELTKRFGFHPGSIGHRTRGFSIVDQIDDEERNACAQIGDLRVKARDGGGNPIDTEALQKPNFRGTAEDGFDSTYRYYYYRPLVAGEDATMSEIESLRQQLAEATEMRRSATDYSIGLQRLIEHAVRGVAIPEHIAATCPHHARLLAEARAGRVPEGWRVEAVEAEGRKGFIVGAPRVHGVRHNTSVWPDDDDPAHRLLYMLLSKQPPAGGVWLDGWGRTKPTIAGAYRVRGFDSNGTTALVEVSRDEDGELRCNIHERNSDDRIERWSFMEEISDDFEWLVIAAQPQQEVGSHE